jgi:hypothetical protein
MHPVNCHKESSIELAKTFIDGGKVDVSIGKSCGDTPLIAICRHMTIKTEDEAAKFINFNSYFLYHK